MIKTVELPLVKIEFIDSIDDLKQYSNYDICITGLDKRSVKLGRKLNKNNIDFVCFVSPENVALTEKSNVYAPNNTCKLNKNNVLVVNFPNWINSLHYYIEMGFKHFVILRLFQSDSWERTCIVSHMNKIIFLPNYKVLYSSIREYFRKNYPEFENAPKTSAGLNTRIEMKDPAFADYFKFTIVRNPWDRVASFYRDKIDKGNNHQNYSKWRHPFAVFLDKEDLKISDVIRIISSVPDSHADNHFIAQYPKIYSNTKSLVDYVAKFETLQKDISAIRDISGLDLQQLKKFNVTNFKNRSYKDYYDSNDAINMVGERYSNDIISFNYVF
ncbi:MAG: sulfotransferase family 2 domain-containing protein [Desulfobacterales bacterium]|nr:sulfotransferase family 2 domain-containing protein [Desulfobacterales bacterium]